MRKFLISLVVASALTPAAAQAQDRGFGRGDRSHGERSSQSDSSSNDRPQRVERVERAERPVRVERTEGSGGAERAVQMERAERPANIDRVERPVQLERTERPASIDRVERSVRLEPAKRSTSIERVKRPVRIERQVHSVQPVKRVRRTEGSDDGFAVQRVPREVQSSSETQVQVHRDGDRDGFSGLHDRIVRNGDQDGNHHRWNGDWRHDHRYDWRSHRSHHSSLYHYGRYYDPYGWGYRRFSIGFNLWPSYYGSSFWLNNPWQYRLPPAYGPYRWVRYYDDALLVNIYTGEVVDVVNNFFW